MRHGCATCRGVAEVNRGLSAAVSNKLVKVRYPCSGLAPVGRRHLVRGLGGVATLGPALGVGEGAVFFGPVVPDRVAADDSTLV